MNMRFRVGLLGPWGPIGSPALGPGPRAPDNNVRARSIARSTAARSTAAWPRRKEYSVPFTEIEGNRSEKTRKQKKIEGNRRELQEIEGNCLLACLSACLLACLLACLPARLLA